MEGHVTGTSIVEEQLAGKKASGAKCTGVANVAQWFGGVERWYSEGKCGSRAKHEILSVDATKSGHEKSGDEAP
jgi:hypothetical protein